MKIIAIIPARYNSTRFPAKVLALIAEKPMLEHVYKNTCRCSQLDQVIIATDHKKIYDIARKFGAQALMTDSNHHSGTDRIAEVARKVDCELVVNVQGDEPLIKPTMIEQVIKPFYREKDLVMSTLKKKIESQQVMNNPDVVKVVTDRNDNALYFSRSLIPYQRVRGAEVYKHIGIYAYSRDFLLKYNKMKTTTLEKSESLEQLRVLENGYRIKVVTTRCDTIGVDQPEDVELVEKELLKNG